MEWLTEIIKSGNALNIILIGILLFVLVRSKYLKVHTTHLQLGAHEDERAIMRRQLEYVREALKSSVRAFPQDLHLNPMYTENVLHSICDLFEDMIVFNHIKDDHEYISVKQSTVYNRVLSITDHEYFLTPEFKELADRTVEDIIKALVRIRKTYK
jgi:hypothetical protein